MPPATLHLVAGSTGAGKTTYAAALCREQGGVRFAVDEWMTALFWMDAPQPPAPDWAIERVERAAALIWRTACDTARAGTPCALELGLTTRDARARYAALARAAGLPIRLHVLDVAADERWRRVEARNRDPGATAQLDFAVTREMFDFVEAMWEPVDEAELAAMDGVRVTG